MHEFAYFRVHFIGGTSYSCLTPCPLNRGRVVFVGKDEGRAAVFSVMLRFYNDGYLLRARAVRDDGSRGGTLYYPISDAPHFIELDWQAASAQGVGDGHLSLWIDGGDPKQTLSDLDTDTKLIDEVWLGPWNRVNVGTYGTYYFDVFESRRQSYIGPDNGG